MKQADYLREAIRKLTDNPTDKCVDWPYSKCDGYGQVVFNRKMARVARIAYELYHGKPPDKMVLHNCDNPACFNPAHLIDGDQKQNMKDCITRGRYRNSMTQHPERPKVKREGLLQIRTDQIRSQLNIICERLGLDPRARGAYVEAATFAVRCAAYDARRTMDVINVVDAELRGMDIGAVVEDGYGRQICHLPMGVDEAAEQMRAEYPEATVNIIRADDAK